MFQVAKGTVNVCKSMWNVLIKDETKSLRPANPRMFCHVLPTKFIHLWRILCRNYILDRRWHARASCCFHFFFHAWSAFNFGPHGPMGPLFLGITQSSRCDWAPLHTPWAKGSSCSGNASRLGPKALATGRQKGGGGFVIHPHVDCEAENAGKEKQH